jgi:hypothetical protein
VNKLDTSTNTPNGGTHRTCSTEHQNKFFDALLDCRTCSGHSVLLVPPLGSRKWSHSKIAEQVLSQQNMSWTL